MRSVLARRVHAHHWHEGAHLIPTRQELCTRLAPEAPDVASHVRRTGEAPIEHRSRGAREVLPGGGNVAGPDCRTEAGHARGEGAVQGVKASVGTPTGAQHLNLHNIPEVIGEVAVLALVIPPKIHAIIEIMCILPGVPLSHGWLQEAEPPAFGVGLRPARWRHPALRSCSAQMGWIAQAGLADRTHAHLQLTVVVGKLSSWSRKRVRIVAKVVIPLLTAWRKVII
mmetsp:Transcript_19535/g.53668  ORF Transcript_19535/g.53668 Transcript_19535/m.53668 type:complete len:226 (-) Transcript_19535:1127-1804(-)